MSVWLRFVPKSPRLLSVWRYLVPEFPRLPGAVKWMR